MIMYLDSAFSFLLLLTYVIFNEVVSLHHSQAPSIEPKLGKESEDILKSINSLDTPPVDAKSKSINSVTTPAANTKSKSAVSLDTWETHNNEKARVPVINFNMDSEIHFEVLTALIYWFKGGDLPYHAGIPTHIQSMLYAARIHGSEVYINGEFVQASDRQEILFNRMHNYSIHTGHHANPDLTVFLTVYASLEYFRVGMAHHWRNNPKLLFIVHDFDTDFLPHEFQEYTKDLNDQSALDDVALEDFLNFRTWDNALGLMPGVPKYVIPSYFPSQGFPKNKNDNWHATFCEQGNLARRGFDPLRRALELVKKDCKWDLKLAGKGRYPPELKRYKQQTTMLHMNDFQFNDFFNFQCDFLLPLVDDTSDPHYFRTKLASTMARAIAYKIPIIGHYKLQEVYPMVEGLFYTDDASFRDRLQQAMECA